VGIENSPPLLIEEGVVMTETGSETLLGRPAAADGDTGPEVTSSGEVRVVREDCWREVHRQFHVARRSKPEIARQLALDPKTARTVLEEAVWQPPGGCS
jgi:hypothetical protein